MKETYEEYIERTSKKDNKDTYETHSNVKLRYFPIDENCPIDGHVCSKEDCEKNWYKNGKCYHFEIDRLMFEIFGTGDNYKYYHNDYKDGEIEWVVTINTTFSRYYKHDEGYDETGIEIRASPESSSYIDRRVLEKTGIVKKFNLEKNSNIKFYKSSYRNINLIRKYLEFIRDNKDLISLIFNEEYACIKCKKSSTFCKIYEDEIICDDCCNEIITEWVKG